MRGFALTVHCPRCGTAKPMGAEALPIVTCVKCGLGFDPKPREQPPPEPEPEVALVRAEPSQLVEQVTANDVHLVIRDSVFQGVWLLLVAIVLVILAWAALGVKEWGYLVALVGLAPVAAYAGMSRLLGRTYLYVSRDVITAWQEPLPRFRERFVHGDIEKLSLRQCNDQSYDVIAREADGEGRSLRLVNANEELATELVDAIRKHRARLGAPVRDQAATRVDSRDT